MERKMKDAKSLVPVELIEKKIYLIRGQKVLLDRDLAELYRVETKVLKQASRETSNDSLMILCLSFPRLSLPIGGHNL
jgi:hypothetical protein